MDTFSPTPILHPKRASPSSERVNFARVLRSGKHTLLMFYSKNCRLCKMLQPVIEEVSNSEKGWLEVARICTDNEKDWAPEMLHYGVEYVPCLVMLLPSGGALTKSAHPRNLGHVEGSLNSMVDYCRP